jgi:uncharacterized protein
MHIKCNFQCSYCYQHPSRETGEALVPYDIEKVIKSIRDLHSKTKGSITLHGGEPTTLPIEDFERIMALSYELTGRTSIQTNGYLINDKYIELFKKYKTGVGVSVDGPYPCNQVRGFGTDMERKAQTETTIENIHKMRKEGISVSVIAVLHRGNALGERRELLKQFLLDLSKIQVCGRLNPCCSTTEWDLTPEELKEAYLDILDFSVKHNIWNWSPYRDLIETLKGTDKAVCVFKPCDPYYSPSAHTILPDGSSGVCIKLYHDGHMYLRDNKYQDIRSYALLQSDCKDCKYWYNCYGGCPGMAIDFDWRRKDRYCEAYKAILEKLSKMMAFLKVPIKKNETTSCDIDISRSHSDGFEHIDSGTRHLDSDIPSPTKHDDSGEHLDGDVRHLDSHKIGDHNDGITHIDSTTKHLDSDL